MIGVDRPPVGRGRRVLAEVAQVSAAGDDVGVVDRFQQDGDAGRLVLAVAVHGDQHVEVAGQEMLKRGGDGCAVAAVRAVGDDPQVEFKSSRSGVCVGGSVVHDQDVGRETANLLEDGPKVPGLVVNRDCSQPTHGASLWVPHHCRPAEKAAATRVRFPLSASERGLGGEVWAAPKTSPPGPPLRSGEGGERH